MHVRENVPLPAVMQWFSYAMAEEEIRMLAQQKMWATKEEQVQILAEIEQRFNILCEPLDDGEMDKMIERAVQQQMNSIAEAPDPMLMPSRGKPPKTILDTPVPIPPELLR